MYVRSTSSFVGLAPEFHLTVAPSPPRFCRRKTSRRWVHFPWSNRQAVGTNLPMLWRWRGQDRRLLRTEYGGFFFLFWLCFLHYCYVVFRVPFSCHVMEHSLEDIVSLEAQGVPSANHRVSLGAYFPKPGRCGRLSLCAHIYLPRSPKLFSELAQQFRRGVYDNMHRGPF